MSKHPLEKHFEAAIVRSLVEHGGYEEGDPGTFDARRGLFPAELMAWLRFAYPERLDRIAARVADVERAVVEALDAEIAANGHVAVLRRGFSCYGQELRLVQFRPAHDLAPDVLRRYEGNRLRVTRQVHQDPDAPEQSVDLVLSVNGFPLATLELKTDATGQTVQAAKKQYHRRDPSAPLFAFRKRAVVHFAVDFDSVRMATHLDRYDTYWLPFDRGHNHGAGNPPVAAGHRTRYLWEEVLTGPSLLEILHRYVHVELPERGTNRPAKVKFPRYHQLDCVRALRDACLENGPGTSYLIEHSAGSGKSLSIGWLAHQLFDLHAERDASSGKVYDTVVVLTDRRVLDDQLRKAIQSLQQTKGTVVAIDKDSRQLESALGKHAGIIVTTIHKFAVVAERIQAQPGRRYAVIVDEAHSSQAGSLAKAVKEVLSGSELERLMAEEAERGEGATDDADPFAADQEALREALLRSDLPNLSYFAFTATPKRETLFAFGHVDDRGEPAPFHRYSMRQAIEEKFIVDVLQGYQTWKAYYDLAPTTNEDPDLPERKAKAALKRFVSSHPTTIAMKAAEIVEHFRHHVADELSGVAKAMVVTSGRKEAALYKRAIDAYVAENGLEAYGSLVAFTGKVPLDGADVTETSMNPPQLGDIAKAFDKPQYRFLIVADKYQTGFDQPKLVAMYVDKPLRGITAVQTLSRLNRSRPGKDLTFVLDFANDRETIQQAFQAYYEGARIDGPPTLDAVAETWERVAAFEVVEDSDVTLLMAVYATDRPGADRVALSGAYAHATQAPKDRFAALDDDAQRAFRSAAGAFTMAYRLYAMLHPTPMPTFEARYRACEALLRAIRARDRDEVEKVDLTDLVRLQDVRLESDAAGPIELAIGAETAMRLPRGGGNGPRAEEPRTPLSELLRQFRALSGIDLTEERTATIVDFGESFCSREEVQSWARSSDPATLRRKLADELPGKAAARYADDPELMAELMSNEELQRRFLAYLVRVVMGGVAG